jgi:hypothetical protein
MGRQFIEYDDRVHALQRRKDFGTFTLSDDGAPLTFQLPHARIGVQPNDQRVTQFPRLFQAADMPRMQKIKTAICENYSPAVAFIPAKPQNRFLKCEHCRVQRISMPARMGVRMPLLKNLVYHAGQGCGPHTCEPQ